MQELKNILVAYQNGERGLPVYHELAAIVERNWEPVAFVNGDDILSMQCGNTSPIGLSAVQSGWHKTSLFTHPPAQPDTEALKASIAELEAQIAAQAGQEPIAHLQMWHTENMDGRDDGFEVCDQHSEGSFPVYVSSVPANAMAIVQAAREESTVSITHLGILTIKDGDLTIENFVFDAHGESITKADIIRAVKSYSMKIFDDEIKILTDTMNNPAVHDCPSITAARRDDGDNQMAMIGASLAHVALNYSQLIGHTLKSGDCTLLRKLHDQWVSAIAASKKDAQ